MLGRVPFLAKTRENRGFPTRIRTDMSKADVKCLFSELWPIEKFVPNPRNPNRHPAAQIQLLGRIILAAGWRSPIVVSRRSGFVVKGHGRLAAAISAGLEEAPVELQDYETEAEESSDLIADNRLAELSDPDSAAILQILSELENDPAFDVGLTGFTEAEFQDMKLSADAAPDRESLTPEDGQSTTGRASKFLRFGKHNFPMTEEEFAEIEKRAEAYRTANGTSYGFVREILGMK